MQIPASSMLLLALFRWPAAETRKRGKVLREPGAGPGLMIIEGQQFPFSLTDLWQSPQPPKIGMVVEAEFNRDGTLVAIRAITPRSGGASRSRPAS
jgi:hypothetical protein